MSKENAALLNNPQEFRRAVICALRTADHERDTYKAALEKYLGDCPLDVSAWRDMLTIHLDSGDLMQARTVAEELGCVLDPMNMFNLITLGDVCFAQGQYLVAAKYFCFVVSCEPNMPRALGCLITTVLSMVEKKEEYIDHLPKYIELALKACDKLIEQYSRHAASSTKDDKRALWYEAQVELFSEVKAQLVEVAD